MTAMFLNGNTVNRCAMAVAGTSVRIRPVSDAALLVVCILVCLRVNMPLA